jgi:hypothetical protein
MSYHTKFDGVLTTLPRVINSNIKVFLRCSRNIILCVGLKEFPLSCFSLENSSLKGFCDLVYSSTLRSGTYVSVSTVFGIDVTCSSHK